MVILYHHFVVFVFADLSCPFLNTASPEAFLSRRKTLFFFFDSDCRFDSERSSDRAEESFPPHSNSYVEVDPPFHVHESVTKGISDVISSSSLSLWPCRETFALPPYFLAVCLRRRPRGMRTATSTRRSTRGARGSASSAWTKGASATAGTPSRTCRRASSTVRCS